ncbi:hypothetical protein EDD17DRAFT_1894762 [Pisolithus thermaeus]|nr:hypothetical protein EDD17DRAFT_1894762 [Pisolithus thermaeus]
MVRPREAAHGADKVLGLASGTALTLLWALADYADLKVSGNLFIEFLHVSTGKNHIVLHVPLEEPVMMGQMVYYATATLYRPNHNRSLQEDGAFYDAEKQAGGDFYPDQLNVKLLTRVELRGPKDDPTVGALINVAKDASIYKFVFLAYTGFTEPKVWKGCRYFMHHRSNDRIAFVYIKGEPDARTRPVDKGDFVRFNHDETEAYVKAVYETAAG